MSCLFAIWWTIGALTNMYYIHTKADEYSNMLESGKIKPRDIFLGVALTMFLWPISIYNNEFRKK